MMSIDYESLKDKAVVLAQESVIMARELTGAGIAKAKELTGTGIAKAKELSEIGKLKMQNSTEQETIRRAYSDLGKLYYAERGSAPEPGYADLCQRIDEAMARITYNNERIADIKAAGQVSDEEVEAVEAEPVEAECDAREEQTDCCCGESPEENAPEE